MREDRRGAVIFHACHTYREAAEHDVQGDGSWDDHCEALADLAIVLGLDLPDGLVWSDRWRRVPAAALQARLGA